MPLAPASPRSAADDRQRATAKWGAACASCASAKAKCIRTNDDPDSKCDRCERLGKDCTGQVHKPRKKRANKPSKTAHLEERLNGFIDLLRASGQLPPDAIDGGSPRASSSAPSLAQDERTASPSAPPPVTTGPPRRDVRVSSLASVSVSAPSLVPASGPVSAPAPAPASAPAPALASPSASAPAPPPPRFAFDPTHIVRVTAPAIPSTYNSFAPPSCICRPEASDTNTDAVETDDVLLSKFRTEVHPLLPLIVLPTYDGRPATAAQLAADRPFLFLAIKTVASVDNYRSMQGLMFQLVSHVADYMLLRAERSMDLLHGLLTILSWYHHHCMMHAQMGNLLHLATSLVCDLSLNRPPRIAERTDVVVLHPHPPSPRTNDERRVLLGLWYLRSSIALCFQRTEPMRFTPYIRQCLQELDDAREVDTDAVLVCAFRMQHLAERIAGLNSRNEAEGDAVDAVDVDVAHLPGYPRAPKDAYRIAFQSELNVLVDSLPAHLRQHKLIQSHIVVLRLRIYEPPLLDVALLKKLSGSLASGAAPAMPTPLDSLHAARQAIAGFFDSFFEIPTSMFPWLPITLYAHVVHAITMLSRWARLMGPIRRPHKATTVSIQNLTSSTTPGSTPAPPDLKDPGYRFVPGQGTAASAPGATSMSFIPGMDSRDLQRDPALLVALARMRDHLRQQPGLAIDIPELLSRLWDRFEQFNREMRATGATKFGDTVGRGMNPWDLTARKIAIMRFKVGRYLDGSTGSSESGPAVPGDGHTGHTGHTSHTGHAGHTGPSRPPPLQGSTDLPHGATRLKTELRAGQGDRGPSQTTMHASHAPTPQAPGFQQGMQYGVPPAQQQRHPLPSRPSFDAHDRFHATAQSQQPSQTQQPSRFAPVPSPYPQASYAQPQQQLPMASLAFSTPAAGMGLHATSVPPPLSGLPPDLGNYVMSGVGVGMADLSYGLGNLEGWETDPLWNAEMLVNSSVNPGVWGDNMDWAPSNTHP